MIAAIKVAAQVAGIALYASAPVQSDGIYGSTYVEDGIAHSCFIQYPAEPGEIEGRIEILDHLCNRRSPKVENNAPSANAELSPKERQVISVYNQALCEDYLSRGDFADLFAENAANQAAHRRGRALWVAGDAFTNVSRLLRDSSFVKTKEAC